MGCPDSRAAARGRLQVLVTQRNRRPKGETHHDNERSTPGTQEGGPQHETQTGPTRRVHANNTRGAAFCGLGAFVGVGKTQRAHVYTAATLPVGPDDYKKIDPEKLARELEVDKCAVNSGRFWMMDEVDYAGGDTVDFHGVKMNWAGDMTGAEMIAQFQSAYVPSLIKRDTIWTWHKGKPVHLLREPGGPVWVLQEYTNAVDSSLTPDNLNTVGSKLKNLPKGWTFETKVLTENLSLDTGRAGGWAAILRDDLHCTYQGCGYGARTAAPTTCRDEESIDPGGRGAPRFPLLTERMGGCSWQRLELRSPSPR